VSTRTTVATRVAEAAAEENGLAGDDNAENDTDDVGTSVRWQGSDNMAATAKSTGAAKDPQAAQAAQTAAAKETAAKNVAANGATVAADDDDNEAGEEEEEGQQGQASRDLNRVRDDGEEAESVDADKLKKVRWSGVPTCTRLRRLIRRGRLLCERGRRGAAVTRKDLWGREGAQGEEGQVVRA